jgi:hypothetical protein
MSCNGSQKEEQSATNPTDETHYQLKNPDFPVEIIEAYVPFVSPSFKSGDSNHVSYELTILNDRTIPFILKAVEVYDVKNPELAIAVYDSTYLSTHFYRHGLPKGNNPMELLGNEFGVVNIWLHLKASDPAPKEVFHKLVFERTKEGQAPKTYKMEVARMPIPEPTTISLGLPFKKGNWLYATAGHKDARFITEGKASYAQRYAIDWLALDDQGRYAVDDRSKNTNWVGYGADVLAVADGTVVAIKDGIIENTAMSETMATPVTRATIAGNYIVLDIGHDIYAVYAHLIPEHLKVAIGDKVKKGQVIGLLGNSGNSDAPHLHFHLETKSPKVLGGEGSKTRNV